ncbi:ABC transporter transmembrane domain-containing protein [Apilactobacillus micheneri]|uniref:ABC transporter transmembrane domain-containing protein n=1 Tax=Apilactobacillus micheneri TaxID=1899430 RepID=UPI000D510473|nr:ABC transporter ATP-binding protein [Apilactobacillus micheneri]GAY79814.1 putative ABC transporter ATP-binding protein [Apilactobacillus micheneri]
MKIKIILICNIILSLISSISNAFVPLFIGKMVDSFNKTSSVLFYVLIIIILICIYLILGRISNKNLKLLLIDGINKLRMKILLKWTSLKVSDYKRKDVFVSFNQLINDDIQNIQQFTIDDFPKIIFQIITFSIALFNLLIISKVLVLILITIYVLYLIPFKSMFKKQFNSQKHLRTINSQIKKFVSEFITNKKQINLLREEKYIFNNMHSLYNQQSKYIELAALYRNNSKLLPRTIDSFGPAIVLFVVGIQVINNNISIGTLISAITYLSLFSAPFKSVMNLLSDLQSANVSLRNIIDFLHYKNIDTNKTIPRFFKSIMINDGYYLISGVSGSGKSTLILNLYFNNNFIIQKNKMIIPQDVFIFPGSVRKNLLREDLSKFNKLISYLPDLNEQIDSFKISTGQKMIINIIRQTKFSANLIFMDEVGANIDFSIKKEIEKFFNEYFKNSTIIEITHNNNRVISHRKINGIFKVGD